MVRGAGFGGPKRGPAGSNAWSGQNDRRVARRPRGRPPEPESPWPGYIFAAKGARSGGGEALGQFFLAVSVPIAVTVIDGVFRTLR